MLNSPKRIQKKRTHIDIHMKHIFRPRMKKKSMENFFFTAFEFITWCKEADSKNENNQFIYDFAVHVFCIFHIHSFSVMRHFRMELLNEANIPNSSQAGSLIETKRNGMKRKSKAPNTHDMFTLNSISFFSRNVRVTFVLAVTLQSKYIFLFFVFVKVINCRALTTFYFAIIIQAGAVIMSRQSWLCFDVIRDF